MIAVSAYIHERVEDVFRPHRALTQVVCVSTGRAVRIHGLGMCEADGVHVDVASPWCRRLQIRDMNEVLLQAGKHSPFVNC